MERSFDDAEGSLDTKLKVKMKDARLRHTSVTAVSLPMLLFMPIRGGVEALPVRVQPSAAETSYVLSG